MAWDDETKAAAIAAFFTKGESAGTIARRVGTTRSAVLGLAHRHRQRLAAAGGSPVKPAPAAAKPAKARGGPPRTLPTGKSRMLDRLAPILGTHMVIDPVGVVLDDLTRDVCRFPVTPHHAGPAEHRFCGASATGPYCPQHARRAYL
jgi:GcrA cell cycle regulator